MTKESKKFNELWELAEADDVCFIFGIPWPVTLTRPIVMHAKLPSGIVVTLWEVERESDPNPFYIFLTDRPKPNLKKANIISEGRDSPILIQQRMAPCADPKDITNAIKKSFGEEIRFQGLNMDGSLLVLLYNEIKGSYSILIRKPGTRIMCLIIAGEQGALFSPVLEKSGTH